MSRLLDAMDGGTQIRRDQETQGQRGLGLTGNPRKPWHEWLKRGIASGAPTGARVQPVATLGTNRHPKVNNQPGERPQSGGDTYPFYPWLNCKGLAHVHTLPKCSRYPLSGYIPLGRNGPKGLVDVHIPIQKKKNNRTRWVQSHDSHGL